MLRIGTDSEIKPEGYVISEHTTATPDGYVIYSEPKEKGHKSTTGKTQHRGEIAR